VREFRSRGSVRGAAGNGRPYREPNEVIDRRVRLNAKVRIDGALRVHSVDPDELFSLRFFATEEESYFMFERDRGEMPVERRSRKDQTYFLKKMLIYYEANRVGEHVRELGIPNFRVATVTTTKQRVEQMIEAQRRSRTGADRTCFGLLTRLRCSRQTRWTRSG
jgi:hypothetical protein